MRRIISITLLVFLLALVAVLMIPIEPTIGMKTELLPVRSYLLALYADDLSPLSGVLAIKPAKKIDTSLIVKKSINNVPKDEKSAIDSTINPIYDESVFAKQRITIEFDLGDDVFESKNQFYEMFFTDYYHFLLLYYPNILDKIKVGSAEDFLAILNKENFDNNDLWNKYTNILSEANTFMVNNNNGLIKDQPTSTFVGYCYRNNMYIKELEFLQLYFGYWRLAEKTATRFNAYADFFSDRYTSLIDVYKFFYYDESSYETYWSKEVHDAFVNPENVVKGFTNRHVYKAGEALPNMLTRRGYTFAGWYLNADFSGDRVYFVPNNNVTLYAKWVVDKEAMDKYDGEFVNMLLYNLSTTKADKSEGKVNSVKALYNALNSNAKKYCTYASILEK